MFENLLALGSEETSNFLDTRLLLKKISVLKLCSVSRVVPHEVLCEKDARIEPGADTWVNFIYSYNTSYVVSK